MAENDIKLLVSEWIEAESLPEMVERETRDLNIDELSSILAIVGPRRSGKTWFMYQIISDLMEKGIEKKDILFIDFEDYRLTGMEPGVIDDILSVFYQLTDRYPSYLFFDEVQHLPEWSRVLRTLHNQNRYKIIVSGSNSNLLSREIATELRGRYEDLLMLPFSFPELLKYRGVSFEKSTFYTPEKGSLLKAFDDYLREGGFPEVIKKKSRMEKRSILQSYYQTLFYKDILERYDIRSNHLLESMMSYCIETMGELFSISRFAGMISESGLPASKKTISNFLDYLQEAFFLIANQKYDFSPRKRLMNPRKIYLLDTGFSAFSLSFSENKGKFLENAVAIHLFRMRKDMFYYRKNRECDFVVKDSRAVQKAIQVCWELNEQNKKREIRALQEAMNDFSIDSGLILTYDQEGEEEAGGKSIRVLPAYKWMLGME